MHQKAPMGEKISPKCACFSWPDGSIEQCTLCKAAPALLAACQAAYEALHVTATPAEFLEGIGNWGFNEKEYLVAKILAEAITTATGQE